MNAGKLLVKTCGMPVIACNNLLFGSANKFSRYWALRKCYVTCSRLKSSFFYSNTFSVKFSGSTPFSVIAQAISTVQHKNVETRHIFWCQKPDFDGVKLIWADKQINS